MARVLRNVVHVAARIAPSIPPPPSPAPHRPMTNPRPFWRALLHARHIRLALCGAVATLLAPEAAHADRAERGTAGRGAARRGATLRGSKAAVDGAYHRARRDGLPFARSRREIERGAREGEYVRLARSTSSYRLRGVAVPYVRPATRAFVARFGADYRRSCGEPLTVTSAMRPTSMHLANSVQKTVHPTGMAVDLRAPRRSACRTWMRGALLGLERQGVLNATEERRPAHFHVVVFREP
jgi:hypothetical protein